MVEEDDPDNVEIEFSNDASGDEDEATFELSLDDGELEVKKES